MPFATTVVSGSRAEQQIHQPTHLILLPANHTETTVNGHLRICHICKVRENSTRNYNNTALEGGLQMVTDLADPRMS